MPRFTFQLDVRDPPAKVIATMVEFRVAPHGGGSRIDFDYRRRSKAVLDRCVGALLQVTGGAPIKQSFRKVYGKPG